VGLYAQVSGRSLSPFWFRESVVSSAQCEQEIESATRAGIADGWVPLARKDSSYALWREARGKDNGVAGGMTQVE